MIKIKTANKYKNKITIIDGIKFDSKLEASHFKKLKYLELATLVKEIERQVKYPLHVDGKKIGTYIADFKFYDVSKDCYRVVDSKGHDTPFARWKRKHCAAEYKIEIEVWKD